MWCSIDMRHLGFHGHLEAMCRQAVDWSQGQLIELYIDHFATDQLLLYISERSSKLKCLQIRHCNNVGDEGLIQASKNFLLLEELHLFRFTNVYKSIEHIGRMCPLLKSFTLFSLDSRFMSFLCEQEEDDEFDFDFVSLAIARNMSGLRHLRLLGNSMTNYGLEAILDGCPNLESLDIRGCFGVLLHERISGRIAQKIKDFKHPFDMSDARYLEAVNSGSCSSREEFDLHYG
ncbi:unnamed protein product [Cuscuta campestris]|uniref:Uncharacterized protein n=1 Tax=Cuscuta campestris TaxID=132261 RepID=A0A484JZY8_9ASTE|nr:unnamed protein product [Cuscuta campestris]